MAAMKSETGMILIEYIFIIFMVLLILRSGFETYLGGFKQALEEVQQERIHYDGKLLWNE